MKDEEAQDYYTVVERKGTSDCAAKQDIEIARRRQLWKSVLSWCLVSESHKHLEVVVHLSSLSDICTKSDFSQASPT